MKSLYFLLPFGLMDDIMLYDKSICREELCVNVSPSISYHMLSTLREALDLLYKLNNSASILNFSLEKNSNLVR